MTPTNPHPLLGATLSALAEAKLTLARWGVPAAHIDNIVELAARVGRLEELSGIGVQK